MLCIKNGLVNDAVNREAYMADILVSGNESELPGKIIAIGTNLEIPEGAEIIDASGLEVYPGFDNKFSNLKGLIFHSDQGLHGNILWQDEERDVLWVRE